jgi:DNA (cytosine-5)-methyltransferase 1
MVAQLVKCATGDITHTLRGVGFDAGEDGTGRSTPLVPVVFKVRGGVEREDGSRGSTNIGKQAGKGYLGSEERAFTLAAAQDQFVAQPVAFHPTQDPISSEDGTTHAMGCGSKGGAATVAVAQPVATDLYNGAIDGDATHSLRVGNGNAMGGVPSVMQPVAMRESGQGYWMQDSISDTMRSDSNRSGKEGTVVAQPVATVMQVRRLTPVECERLQGFPDGFTNIPWRKKPEAPDGPRYKALGNSMAVNCMRWIGERIQQVEDIHGD